MRETKREREREIEKWKKRKIFFDGMYAEAVNFWGCVEAVGLPAIQRWGYPTEEIKHSRHFKVLCSHLLEIQGIEIIQQKRKSRGFQNTCFFFNMCGATHA